MSERCHSSSRWCHNSISASEVATVSLTAPLIVPLAAAPPTSPRTAAAPRKSASRMAFQSAGGYGGGDVGTIKQRFDGDGYSTSVERLLCARPPSQLPAPAATGTNFPCHTVGDWSRRAGRRHLLFSERNVRRPVAQEHQDAQTAPQRCRRRRHQESRKGQEKVENTANCVVCFTHEYS